MHTLTHPLSGERISGVRLPAGTKVAEGDKYDSSTGNWEEAGGAIGLTIQKGCTTIWVRQPGPLSENAHILLSYLNLKPWGEATCIGERNHHFYVIPDSSFNWDGRFDIEAMRVAHPECVQELLDHGYLMFAEHDVRNSMSDYSTAWGGTKNQVYLVTEDGKNFVTQ